MDANSLNLVRSSKDTGNSPQLSWSAIATYLICPLKCYFRRIETREEEFVSVSRVLGIAIHVALRWHFEQLMAANAPAGAPDLMELVEKVWLEYTDRPI